MSSFKIHGTRPTTNGASSTTTGRGGSDYPKKMSEVLALEDYGVKTTNCGIDDQTFCVIQLIRHIGINLKIQMVITGTLTSGLNFGHIRGILRCLKAEVLSVRA